MQLLDIEKKKKKHFQLPSTNITEECNKYVIKDENVHH